ncbi:hypothetical protein [Paracoccus sp. S-4012]|uniref:hypothetical protein n=1 Tax=Paracoccus sp. S-4012 TaxID=2665648 RepID=UPI00351B23A3
MAVFRRGPDRHLRGLVCARGNPLIHAINSPTREGFHWLAILFTFALGTAAGNLMAEQLGLGDLPSAFVFASASRPCSRPGA